MSSYIYRYIIIKLHNLLNHANDWWLKEMLKTQLSQQLNLPAEKTRRCSGFLNLSSRIGIPSNLTCDITSYSWFLSKTNPPILIHPSIHPSCGNFPVKKLWQRYQANQLGTSYLSKGFTLPLVSLGFICWASDTKGCHLLSQPLHDSSSWQELWI